MARTRRICKNHGFKGRRPPKTPNPVDKGDVEEIKRLMKRRISPVINKPDGCRECLVCYGKSHRWIYCPWLKHVPSDVVVGPGFDVACSGCGRIGETCCDIGGHAVPKQCCFCGRSGHWYWEDRCSKDYHPSPLIQCVWNPIMKAIMEEAAATTSCNKDEDDKEEVVVDDGQSRWRDNMSGINLGCLRQTSRNLRHVVLHMHQKFRFLSTGFYLLLNDRVDGKRPHKLSSFTFTQINYPEPEPPLLSSLSQTLLNLT